MNIDFLGSPFARKCSVFIFAIFLTSYGFSQDFNTNYKLSFINHTTPKSPESASFEKYGTIPVSEQTGVPSIEVPLYILTNNSLSVPVSLSYHASGIKVNQEATWVGLGWDIMAGGRITLDIKGGWDKYTKQFIQPSSMKSTLRYIMTTFTGSSPTYATVVNGPDLCGKFYVNNYPYNVGHCGILDIDSLNGSTFFTDLKTIFEKGIAEPDLYHASFMGKSITFYRDLLTDSIRIKGDENLYKIEEIENSAYSSSFIITDDQGVSYSFQQEERSFYQPALENLFPSVTTAWLLTAITRPNGDAINFSYTNFGTVLPAPQISENENSDETGYHSFSNTFNYGSANGSQKIYQEPQYLTKIRSKSVDIDFILGNRKDLGGDGARLLNMLEIKSRINNEVFQRVKFNYDYLTASIASNIYFDTTRLQFGTPGPDNSVLNHLTLRLRLKSADIYGSDTGSAKTYKFYYRDNGIYNLPNKVSLSQDHWGYYNGKNLPNSPGLISFTPTLASLLQEGVLSSTNVNVWINQSGASSINLANIFSGHADRMADTAANSLAAAGILDSIVYPTGGSSKFEYEVHRSYYAKKNNGPLIGGGLRIKKISNYNKYNSFEESKKYEYKLPDGSSSGIYMGNLDYLQVQNRVIVEQPGPLDSVYRDEYSPSFALYSNGNLSGDGSLIMYSTVKEIINEYEGGYIEKKFDIYYPSGDPFNASNYPITDHMYLSPVPHQYSHGALLYEKVYDKNGNIKRTKEYFYSQIDKTNEFYGFKTSLRYIYHPSMPNDNDEYPYFRFFEPMHSYYQLLDSTVDRSYESNEVITSKSILRYNQFFQQEYETSINSKGEHLIAYTKTPLAFTDLPQGDADLQGNAQAISHMRLRNIVNVPVERIIFKKSPLTDTIVLRGAYNIFDVIGNIKQTYLTNISSPVPLTQFNRSKYGGPIGGYNILKDTRYELDKAAFYSGISVDLGTGGVIQTGPYLKEIVSRNITQAFLYDTTSYNIIAMAEGTNEANIAYTSFEIPHPGHWSYSGGTTIDNTAPTGTKCYNLEGGSITSGGLDPTKVYILSYWTKNTTSYTVSGTISGSVVKGISLQDWNYFEQKITNQTSVSISGTGYIDEIKLYPASAQMKSFTYDAASRLISESGLRGKVTYYEYDASNRLNLIRDQDRNILKKFSYKYAGQKINFDGQYYLSNMQSGSWTKSNCSSGFPQSITYAVPEGKYKSLISQDDADQQSINDLNNNGQSHANTYGGCQFFNQYQEVTFTQNNCPSGYSGSTVTYSVPANKYVSLIDQTTANQLAQAELQAISSNGQAVANQGTCTPIPAMITINCTSSVPEPFSLELYNVSTHVYYYFTILDYGAIGQVPAGVYNVRINPENYTQSYSYTINDSYYQSGVISATFENISFTDSNSSTIYIY